MAWPAGLAEGDTTEGDSAEADGVCATSVVASSSEAHRLQHIRFRESAEIVIAEMPNHISLRQLILRQSKGNQRHSAKGCQQTGDGSTGQNHVGTGNLRCSLRERAAVCQSNGPQTGQLVFDGER